MKLLDEQLKQSLHGNFEEGWKICKKLEEEIFQSKAQIYIDEQESYIKYKQMEEKRLNSIRANFNRGWYVIMHGDLYKGFSLMNEGRHASLWGNKHIGTDKPLWNGEDLGGKHILFVCEAGYGDQILFIRFVKEIAKKGGKVIVACDDYGLSSVFSRLPEVSAVVAYKNALSVYHDCWVPSMAAPQMLRTTYDNLSSSPYITARDEQVKGFESLIKSDKLKVGIRWLSMPREGVCNTLGDAYLSRKFPADLMFDAVMQDHVQLYSLQRDEGTEQLPRMSSIVDLEPLLQSWENTAGAIANLDLVISSCTSVAHLAAAMGKPTWIIVPLMAYYTWALPGNKTPWYDSVKLFRQEEYQKWDKPFEKVKQELSLLGDKNK